MLELDLAVPEWHKDAACAEHEHDADRWFSSRAEDIDFAKGICLTCLVWPECLAHALDEPKLPGTWGGTTEGDRKALLDERVVTSDLLREWGRHALRGREFEKDAQFERMRWAELGIAG